MNVIGIISEETALQMYDNFSDLEIQIIEERPGGRCKFLVKRGPKGDFRLLLCTENWSANLVDAIAAVANLFISVSVVTTRSPRSSTLRITEESLAPILMVLSEKKSVRNWELFSTEKP